MPQVVSNNENISQEQDTRPTADIRALVERLMRYEDELKKHQIDTASSRFYMLSAAEQDFLRAEMVGDFIRLSAGNLGTTPVFFSTGLYRFCNKISDLRLPSIEIMGTYLAALEISKQDKLEDKIKDFDRLLKSTMQQVLQNCIEILESKTLSPVIVPQKSRTKPASSV